MFFFSFELLCNTREKLISGMALLIDHLKGISMYVPLEPFADLIKLADSLVEQAPDEGFTDVSCLTELFVCYPNFFFK